MRIYKHDSYKEYKKSQVKANKRKIKFVWASSKEIREISSYIKKRIPNAKTGICHGVRNGWEVRYFCKCLKIPVIGTEISSTARQFKGVICWDFHKVKDEWLNAIDFIYSNSFDHTYDPYYCLSQWMSCIKPTGRCFIEWAEASENKWDSCDCFSASFKEYKKVVKRDFELENVISLICKKHGHMWKKNKNKTLQAERKILVVKHRTT